MFLPAVRTGMLLSMPGGLACPLSRDDECGGWSLGCALHYGGPNDCGVLFSAASAWNSPSGQYQLRLTPNGNVELALYRQLQDWPYDRVYGLIVWATSVPYPVASSGSAVVVNGRNRIAWTSGRNAGA